MICGPFYEKEISYDPRGSGASTYCLTCANCKGSTDYSDWDSLEVARAKREIAFFHCPKYNYLREIYKKSEENVNDHIDALKAVITKNQQEIVDYRKKLLDLRHKLMSEINKE